MHKALKECKEKLHHMHEDIEH
jgi:chromosome segregation ATPase